MSSRSTPIATRADPDGDCGFSIAALVRRLMWALQIRHKRRALRPLDDLIAHNVGSYWHPVGTCAMGVHREAVVDPMLRVYGTTNLCVADASIMPAITGGNTNAPAIISQSGQHR